MMVLDGIYTKGQLLQIRTIDNEIFEARFLDIDDKKCFLRVYELRSQEGSQMESITHFTDSEILDIQRLNSLSDIRVDPLRNIMLSQDEFEQIVKVSCRYIYIDQVEDKFDEAIQDLSQCKHISLSTDGETMGRKSKMPFIVLSSPTQIYIFDIQSMRAHAFGAGLKKLLESEYPKKIIHDSRFIGDCLFHSHNIKLSSVFDTLVAHLILVKSKSKGSIVPKEAASLQECLNIYLGLPLSIVQEIDILKCTSRPLSLDTKDALAKNISFLHKLFEVIEIQMQLPYMRGVACFTKELRPRDDYMYCKLSHKQDQIPTEFCAQVEY